MSEKCKPPYVTFNGLDFLTITFEREDLWGWIESTQYKKLTQTPIEDLPLLIVLKPQWDSERVLNKAISLRLEGYEFPLLTDTREVKHD